MALGWTSLKRFSRGSCARLASIRRLMSDLKAPAEPALSSPGYPPGVLPKHETQALDFLRKLPLADGRGVRVAVLDTGVDPAAPGLQTTPDGRPKITHLIDCTGSGDVIMTKRSVQSAVDPKDSKEAEAEAEAVAASKFVQLVSGRNLSIPESWGEVTHVYTGIKFAEDLFAKSVLERLGEETSKDWEAKQLERLAELVRQKKAFDSEKNETLSKDFEDRISVLRDLQKGYSFSNPVFDCFMFLHSVKKHWIVGISEFNGIVEDVNGSSVTLIRPYDNSLLGVTDVPQIGRFSDKDCVSYTVNVFEDLGSSDKATLSIVTTPSSHGTHVAGIIGAFFDEELTNGVAPGVEIVSLKIGDTRLGTMETGTAIVRAANLAVQLGCDIANMSYGEPAFGNDGRIIDAIDDAVDKGLIFVASAGNNGPALTSVGAPASCGRDKAGGVISVGAVVTPSMMQSEYAMRETLNPRHYTWSSRGPSVDGATGVSISAPGAAIAPVSQWSLQKCQLMNGTSMSSPNAAGNIALLVSALKQEKHEITPHRIRKAVEFGASRTYGGLDRFALGHGFIQTLDAYNYFQKNKSYLDQDVYFKIKVPARNSARGIYLREPHEVNRVWDIDVSIDPVFQENKDNEAKLKFESRLLLKSKQDWIKHADSLLLSYSGRSIEVQVDPTGLSHGAHHGEILAYDAENVERGIVFSIPVTVVRPIQLKSNEWSSEKLKFTAGDIERTFFAVPEGARYATIEVDTISATSSHMFYLHALYLKSETNLDDTELHKNFIVHTDDFSSQAHTMPVVPGRTLEVTLAQNWRSLGTSELLLRVSFNGLNHDKSVLNLSPAKSFSDITFSNKFDAQEWELSSSLKFLETELYPESSDDSGGEITPLSKERDLMLSGKQVHQLLLDYGFELGESSTITFRAPILSDFLYDSIFESQLWMIFDSNKKKVAQGDAFPKPTSLPAGKFNVKLQVRHDNLELLEQLKKMPVVLVKKLSKEIKLSAYPSFASAFAQKSSVTKRKILKDHSWRVVIGSYYEAIKKNLNKKTTGKGNFSLKGELVLSPSSGKVNNSEKFRIPVVFSDAVFSEKEKSSKSKDKKDDFDLKKSFGSGISKWLDSLEKQEASKKSSEIEELVKDYAGDLDLRYSLMKLFSPDSGSEKDLNILRKSRESIENVLKLIDRDELAKSLSLNLDEKEKASGKDDRNQKKSILIDCLHRTAKINARIVDLISPETKEWNIDDEKKRLADSLSELKKWVDLDSDSKYLDINLTSLGPEKQGAGLKLVNKFISDATEAPSKALIEKRIQLLNKLGWREWEAYFNKQKIRDFPQEYCPF